MPVESQHRPIRGTVRDQLVAIAVAHIEAEGMSVSLEHLSLERVIAESGVSRASAYRHFTSKSDFLTAVLTTVVQSTRLEGETPEQAADLLTLIADRRDALSSAQGRRNLTVEGLRRATHADIDRVAASTRWQTYLALNATRRSLPEGELRSRVRTALADTEARFVAHRAEVYTRLATLLGYRLRPPLVTPEGFALMSDAAGALMTGLVVRTRPEGAVPTMRIAAHGSTEAAVWTWPAHHLVGLVLSYLEPDPNISWDDEQLQTAASTLDAMVQALAETGQDGP